MMRLRFGTRIALVYPGSGTIRARHERAIKVCPSDTMEIADSLAAHGHA